MERVELQRLRDGFRSYVQLAAADEAFEITYRGEAALVLMSLASWQLGADEAAVPADSIVDLAISEGRKLLGTRRIAAQRDAEHTRILWGYSGQPLAMLAPVSWARSTKALSPLFDDTNPD
ncbi:hypothetical protein ACFVVM_32505 [Nocardia sp. NPDC058176]|uniref:hypothetical protein n=1 Tax=Nocardia sp. NPDC058176 TaxID=3346368 RepID=UPI0036DADDE4